MNIILRWLGFRPLSDISDRREVREIIGYFVKNRTTGEFVRIEGYDVDHMKIDRYVLVTGWYFRWIESQYDLAKFDVQRVSYLTKAGFEELPGWDET